MSGAILLLPPYAFMVLTGQLYLFTSTAVWNMIPQRLRFCTCFLFEAVLTVKIDESLSFETT
jgi:predicted small integral membrane protein